MGRGLAIGEQVDRANAMWHLSHRSRLLADPARAPFQSPDGTRVWFAQVNAEIEGVLGSVAD